MWTAPTFVFGHVLHFHTPHFSHVAQDSENDKPREEAGEAVDDAGDHSIPARQAEKEGGREREKRVPHGPSAGSGLLTVTFWQPWQLDGSMPPPPASHSQNQVHFWSVLPRKHQIQGSRITKSMLGNSWG